MEEFERRMIGRALQISGGSKREAARLLQINRTTLIEKLKRRGWEFREGALEPKPTEATTQWPKLGPAPATRPLSEPQPMPTALAAQAG